MAPRPYLSILLHILWIIGLSQGYQVLSDETFKSIPGPGEDFDIHNGKLLAPILKPRVPGTPGSTEVLNHFLDFFRNDLPQWKLTFQNSTSKTPKTDGRDVPFKNLVASRDPPWSQPGEVGYLTLVAHYDSKLEPDGFIGAIDSAVPCAVLMHVARSIDEALTKKWASAEEVDSKQDEFDGILEGHKGIQLFFLDGEEAFDVWSSTDSVYGARSLAAEMETTVHPALSTYHNALSSISLFVLLDLLGSESPSIPSYFKTTHWAYQKMGRAEQKLRKTGKLKTRAKSTWFPDVEKNTEGVWIGGAIGDDHVPFMARGVEVLHVIPSHFPRVWHTMDDDGDHLDMESCEDWAIITTAFAAEWMELEGHMDVKSGGKQKPRFQDEVISKTEL